MAEVILYPFLSGLIAKEVHPGLEKVAEAGAEDARAHVPVLTGNLQSTIAVVESDDGWLVEVSTGYWQFVEFGTIYMQAQPFMRTIIENIGLSR